jgi:agmatinase
MKRDWEDILTLSSRTIRSNSFLPQALAPRDKTKALFHVIPVPYEATVSYGHGTAKGPQAILTASQYVEEYDGISVPADAGIYVEPAIRVKGLKDEQVFDRIEKNVRAVFHEGSIPVILGGEHSLTVGPVRAILKSGHRFGVVHFDAHSDLRDVYQGSRNSHACAMRRVLDLGIPVFQIGIRSFDRHDPHVRRKRRVGHLDADAIARQGIPKNILPANFPKKIYISFDVDAFDCSLMPSTGTPEPGGLFWDDAIAALEKVIRGRQVLGFDTVELAPIPGLHAPDFVAAKLVYSIMGMVVRNMLR